VVADRDDGRRLDRRFKSAAPRRAARHGSYESSMVAVSAATLGLRVSTYRWSELSQVFFSECADMLSGTPEPRLSDRRDEHSQGRPPVGLPLYAGRSLRHG
jgi:hypothetical protein